MKLSKTITKRIDDITHIPDEYRNVTPPPPKAVKIELTANCDFKCWFCATRKDLRTKKNMNYNLYKRLVKEMVEYGVEELGLFYLGESTLYPKLADAIKFAKDAGIKYVFLTTNGFRADKEKLRKLFNAGLDSIKFSFNYPNIDACKKATGVNAYNNIITNIKAAYDLRYKFDYNVGIYASTIEYSKDAHIEMQDALAEISDYVDEHYWLPLYNQGGFVKEETDGNDVIGNPGRVGAESNPDICWSLFTSGHITYDGKFSACCFDHDGRFTMGDLTKESFHDCWHGIKFQSLRKKHLSDNTNGTPCAVCLHRGGKDGPCNKTNKTV